MSHQSMHSTSQAPNGQTLTAHRRLSRPQISTDNTSAKWTNADSTPSNSEDHNPARAQQQNECCYDTTGFRSQDLQSHNLTRCQLRHCIIGSLRLNPDVNLVNGSRCCISHSYSIYCKFLTLCTDENPQTSRVKRSLNFPPSVSTCPLTKQ